MAATFAARAAAGGFTAARTDLARGERSLALLLNQRARRGHFTAHEPYRPEQRMPVKVAAPVRRDGHRRVRPVQG
ncbi:hypothetical protein [Curtobacterium sp. MCSS17_016]|uniref:hypothetical protein n=1 Tax=Curtobacterium sp. MCSS17_016 TaxID=2175644 RepID=UPI0011B4F8C5|nr:hypothetical protein [Curtobacterium sp. MCSS17_016]WIE81439.1 hypothetical protein DEJ19_019580 [Curtobacterium sp. MCSS17_016]